MKTLVDKFHALENEVRNEILERPQEIHTSVLALLSRKHQFQVGPPGCLAGDTVIPVNRAGNGRQYALEDLVKKFNGESIASGYREYSWDPEIPTYVQSVYEDGIRLNLLENAWCSGVKTTYELTTANGRVIRATDEHPFLTAEGVFARLDELSVGDFVQVDAGIINTGGRTKLQYRDRATNYHPRQRKGSPFLDYEGRVAEHRLMIEADINGLTLEDYLHALRWDKDASSSFTYLTPDDIVHHVDGNHLNNDLSNLEVTTTSLHGVEHSQAATKRILRQVETDRITSIRKVGEEMTYDLEVADDPHNFVANGFAVHNTAKSLTVERVCARIGDLGEEGYFRWLLTQYTTPDELFGGPDFNKLREHGIYKRVTEHKLPRAYVAFLDEIFKGSSAILNTNLSIMNERIFNNVDDNPKVPLISMFGASNEVPAGDELSALWDRLHFRHKVSALRESSNFVKMLSTPIPENPAPVVSLEDIAAANVLVQQVRITDDVFEALRDLRSDLMKASIEPSERRWVDAVAIIRAEAFFNGRDTADTEDTRPLMHVLWNREDDMREVRKQVLELANPLDRECAELLDRVHDLEGEFHRAQGLQNVQEKQRDLMEIFDKMKRLFAGDHAIKGLISLRTDIEESGKTSFMIDELNSRSETLGKEVKYEIQQIKKAGSSS